MSTYLHWEPINGGKTVYIWTWNQLHEGSEYIRSVGTNQWREESIYLELDPITGGKRVYALSGNQSQEGRAYIPGVGANHRREESNTNIE